MKKISLFLLLSVIISCVLVSCGNDDNNTVIDEPTNNKEDSYPKELVGTWVYYSGNPNSLYVDFNGSDILNITFTLTSNGNLSESFVFYSPDYERKTTSTIGNWYVENKKLIVTDWYGNKVSNDLSYKFENDNSLVLTINGNSAVFYKQEVIETFYSNLIIGTWNNNRPGGGKTRISFNSNGKGSRESTYIDGRYYSRALFTWSCSGNELIIKDQETDITTKEKLIYLNKRSYSSGTFCYTKE